MAIRYRRHPLIAERIVGGQAFIVTDNRLQSLNETGTYLWSLLTSPKSAEELGEAMCQEFDVELQTAVADAKACMEDLIRRQIVESVE